MAAHYSRLVSSGDGTLCRRLVAGFNAYRKIRQRAMATRAAAHENVAATTSFQFRTATRCGLGIAALWIGLFKSELGGNQCGTITRCAANGRLWYRYATCHVND